jgi:N-acetyl-anhydromuramyl-L-alanine amidase AmpD
MPAVANVVANDTGEDLTELFNSEAARNHLPSELLVALAIAESELNVQSQRWGRHSAQARAAVEADDRVALEALLARIEQETPGDISFGLFQQTVRWADEGDHSTSIQNVFHLRDLYFDPRHATAVAARKLAAYWRRFGDPLEALCRYNKPALEGSTNPHRARYRKSLNRAGAFLAGGEGNGRPAPGDVPAEPTPTLVIDERISPNRQGRRAETVGVVIHSTRGGTADAETDYRATINWFLNPASEVSAHMVVGPSRVCRMVPDDEVAWHAGENNHTHLGMEIAQTRVDAPYSDSQYRAAAAVVRGWCERYGIPMEHVGSQTQRGLIGHQETEQGRRVGKSDPGPTFNWDYFMRLVRQETATQPSNEKVVGEGFRAFLVDHPEAGQPRHDEQHDLFGNGYVWLTLTPTYSQGALLLWRKWLNRVKLVSWEPGTAQLAGGGIAAYLAAHPEAGAARHEEQRDVFDNRFVWLTPSQAYRQGALLWWRRWMDSVQLISWEDAPVDGTGLAGSRPAHRPQAQCQVDRHNYDSEEDYQLWAGPRPNGTFDTASCSAAALATLLTAYDRPTNISGAIRILGPTRISTAFGLLDASLEGMLQALGAIAVAAERGYLRYDELLQWLGEGTPAILDLPGMFNGIGHILVAESGDPQGCDLVDSARRERPRWRASRAELEELSRRADHRIASLRIRS